MIWACLNRPLARIKESNAPPSIFRVGSGTESLVRIARIKRDGQQLFNQQAGTALISENFMLNAGEKPDTHENVDTQCDSSRVATPVSHLLPLPETVARSSRLGTGTHTVGFVAQTNPSSTSSCFFAPWRKINQNPVVIDSL